MADVRRPPQNIPIEVLRTAVAIADAGTFTKAASRLGISQPAVSAQVKRLQQIIGDDIFQRGVGGNIPTNLGNTVLLLARKTLETHDQLLRLSASTAAAPQKIRIGFSPFLVGQFMAAQTSAANLANVFVQSDRSEILQRALLDDRLDIACSFIVGDVPDDAKRFIVAEQNDDLIWVRSKEFVLSPGRPVPIVSWRGDDWMTTSLVQHGLSYQVVFEGEEFEGKRAAVEAGQGLTALPSRVIPASLIRAREYYLPPLPTARLILFARPTDRTEKMAALLAQIHGLFFESPNEPTRHRLAV